MAEGKTKAPTVDGKRLAVLENSVSALAITLTANGLVLEDGQDPVEQAIAVVKHCRELTLARTELQLAVAIAVGVEPETIEDPFAAAAGALETMKAHIEELRAGSKEETATLATVPILEHELGAARTRIAELEQKLAAGPDNATEGEIAAIARAETAEKRVAELEEETAELKIDVEELASARNRLANQLAEEGKGQAGVEPELEEPEAPVPVARERSEDARDVGPTFGRLTHGEMQQLVDAGAGLELAFSNGDFELVEFSSPAIEIAAADMIRVDSSRYIVGKAVHVKGADHPEHLHGVGLLLEGSQVGYCPFDPPLLLLPGHEWKFDRQLVF